MNELEQYLLEKDTLYADDNFISDGVIIVSKCPLTKKYLKAYKHFPFKDIDMNKYTEKGEEVFIGVGTKCVLLQDETIGIKYKENNYFDYRLTRLIKHSIWGSETYIQKVDNLFYKSEKHNGYILQFFDSEDVFIAGLVSIKNDCEVSDV